MFYDIWEQTVITELVKREHAAIRRQAGGDEQWDNPATRILPLKQQNGRTVKIRYRDILPVGLAQFKAPGASPALWTTKPRLREEVITVQDIDEFHRIDPVDMLKLKSPDPNVAEEAMLSIVERGAALQQRNEDRTEWMRWEALKGSLTVPFPNAGSLTIDYGIPVGHFVTMGTPWTDVVNSDPVEDLWALGSVGLTDAGVYLPNFHMNTVTHRLLRRNEKIRDQLSSYGRSNVLPTDADLRDLLREGSTMVIIDSGWFTDQQTDFAVTKWLADYKVMATTADYTYAGHRIGDVADAWVLVGPEGSAANQPVARQGMQSEWIYDRKSQQTLLRQASSRMPRLYAPEAIAWGTVN